MAKATLLDSVDSRKHTKSLSEIIDSAPNKQLEVEISRIKTSFTFSPNRRPLRHYYDHAAIEQWATNDLKVNGIHSPLWVRPHPHSENDYELVAGQRRLIGSQFLGLIKVPVRIFDWTDQQAFEAAMVENSNREDFTALEEVDHIYAIIGRELKIDDHEQITSLIHRLENERRGKVKESSENDHAREVINKIFDTYGQISFRTFVRMRLPLRKLQSDVLDVIRNGEVPYITGLEISKVKDNDERKELILHVVDNKLPLSKVKNQVKGSTKSISSVTNVVISKRLKSMNKILKDKELTNEVADKIEKLLNQIEKELVK
jgi:ParB family transcriptional regulator, chromosome partitioning protein